MPPKNSLTVALLWCALLSFGGSGVAQTKYSNPRQGFEITPPLDWTRIPSRAGEKWIVARFQASRETSYRNESLKQTFQHRATLKVIVFPKKVEAVKTKVEEKGDVKIVTTVISNPYKDFKDYVKRHEMGGGWFWSKEEEIRVSDLEATWAEIKVEASANVPLRLMALIYHLEDRDVAVVTDLVETDYDKLADSRLRCLKSFRPIPVTATAGTEEDEDPFEDLGTGTGAPTTREFAVKVAERRKRARKREFVRLAEDLPKGWKVKKGAETILVYNAGEKYIAHISKLAKSVREWLDEEFGAIGDDEVLPALIRVFATADEARGYFSGSGDSFSFRSDTGEIVCAQAEGSIMGDFARLSSAMIEQFFADKNPVLWEALPNWLSAGLSSYCGSAFPSKAKGLVFVPPAMTIANAYKARKEGKLMPVRDLVSTVLGSSDDQSSPYRDTWATMSELFVRYLIENDKGRAKGLLFNWLDFSVALLDKFDQTEWDRIDIGTAKSAETEEEEEALAKKRREESKKWARAHADQKQQVLDDTLAQVFRDWSDKDWDQLQKEFDSWLRRTSGN